MKLTEDEEKMLSGEYGLGVQKSMELLAKWGDLFEAERTVKVNSVHMSTNTPTEFVMEMSKGTEKARAFCTTHAVYDPKLWKDKFGLVVEELAGGYATTDQEEFERRMALLKKLGFLPTFTCSPYSIGIIPRANDVLCWTGSSGQVISNSFFGARAGRESVSTCFAAAITGRTPLMGLLKKENRYAELLVKVDKSIDINNFTEADYGALGYFIGGIAGPRNAAIEGLPSDITFENGRMLLSPLPVSGACVMCHIVGVTPEARTVEEALGGRKPESIMAGERDIAEAYQKLSNSTRNEVDMVVIGCPHLTIGDIGELTSLIEGKMVSQNLRLVVGVSNPVYTLAKECGYTKAIEMAGGMFVNSCIGPLNPFMFLKNGGKVAATNSARGAHYMQRMSQGKTKTFYGDMRKCVQAAIKGKWEE
jgi:predicted aconitase